jgi:COP9 signalosome complex subunit 2
VLKVWDSEVAVHHGTNVALKEEEPRRATEEFREIVGKDEEWTFKALKQLVKLSFLLGEKDDVLKYYRDVVGMINLPIISKNYGEKSLSNLLERLSCNDTAFLESIYSITLEGLKGINERLWMKIALRLTNINIQEEKVTNAERILQELLQVSTQETQLLELYSLAIQLYTLTGNVKKVKFYYAKTLKINSAIPHPRILGVIKECGGKMLMRESMSFL